MGCVNNVCRNTRKEGNIDFPNWDRNLFMKTSILFFKITLSVLDFVYSSEIPVFRSDPLSLMYRCLLPSYTTVKIVYKENMEIALYATNDDTPL